MIPNIIQDTCTYTEKQRDLINFVFSEGIPWYRACSTQNKYKVFQHELMTRNIDEEPLRRGIIVSPLYEVAISIFDDFCLKHNVKYNQIFRASFNLTHHHTGDMTDAHLDHNKEYDQNYFILYLNDFTNGKTYLYDDYGNYLMDIKPYKNKAVIFPKYYHAQGFCSEDEHRIILLVTFS